MTPPEQGTGTVKNGTFQEKSKTIIEGGLLTLLIIVKNSIIFVSFLLVDRLILWIVSSSISDAATRFSPITILLDGLNIFSSVIIAASYAVYVSMELYKHRRDILGVPGKTTEEE